MIEVDFSWYTDMKRARDLKKASDIPSWKNLMASPQKTINGINHTLSLQKVDCALVQLFGRKMCCRWEIFCEVSLAWSKTDIVYHNLEHSVILAFFKLPQLTTEIVNLIAKQDQLAKIHTLQGLSMKCWAQHSLHKTGSWVRLKMTLAIICKNSANKNERRFSPHWTNGCRMCRNLRFKQYKKSDRCPRRTWEGEKYRESERLSDGSITARNIYKDIKRWKCRNWEHRFR